jgi:hypothetical protein
MDAGHETFTGPPVDDPETLARLPADLAAVLRRSNGYVRFHGGFHLRGACREPAWHSLRGAWDGPSSFARLYPETVTTADVPFAEDCVGDQFLLRDGRVWRLLAETGDVEPLGVGLTDFLAAAEDDPVGYLSLNPLLQYHREGGRLEPGQLLSVYPPFCTAEAAEGVILAAVPAAERRRFLADLAAQLRGIPDGGRIELRADG